MKVKIKTKLILILFTESYFMLRRKQLFSKYNVHVPLLLNCFAKTYNNEKGSVSFGRTVDSHCKIVGNIASYLLSNFCKENVRSLFPSDSDLIVAVHDLGKISPTFQLKIVKAVDRDNWKTDYPEYSQYDIYPESAFGGHSTVSYAFFESINLSVAVIAGQHHGELHPCAVTKKDSSDGFGGKKWSELRNEEFSELCKYFNKNLEEELSEAQISLLSGLTCVSDWIGSGQIFDDPKIGNDPNTIKRAVYEAGFRNFDIKKNLSFEDIFGFHPNSIQKSFIDKIDGPGLYIVEAPMGIGKTELALYAAYKMLLSDNASGIYFALPTQLTSNKIYERVSSFLKQVVDGEDFAHSLLLHSNANLIKDKLGATAAPGNSWFSTAKRGLLYPFAVGTLDQVLLSDMNVRHSFVRYFGLAGKVVIIDEVHTYDCYTGTILDYLVKDLIEIGCTVIILSATLNPERRSELLGKQLPTEAYPVMSYAKDKRQFYGEVFPAEKLQEKEINIDLKKEKDCFEEALLRASSGQQVLWIENTVHDAQKSFKKIAFRAIEQNIECGLIHSRFISKDRSEKESYWVDLLGKNSSSKERNKQGRLLIGTQVLEQSLDIDADFLITRFAPTDMLLQRIGRLWRHSSTFRPIGAKQEAWIIDMDLEEALRSEGKIFAKSSFVYSPYILCRSLEVWKHSLVNGKLTVPFDIRNLINKTYANRKETDENLQKMYCDLYDGTNARKGIRSLRALARSAVATSGIVLSEESAMTRYSEMPEVRLLIVRDYMLKENVTEFELCSGNKVAIFKNADKNAQQTRNVAVEIMLNTVKCRESLAPTQLSIRRVIELGLDNYFYVGDKKDPERASRICIMVQKKSGCLDNFNEFAEDKYLYKYSSKFGLEVIKSDEQ